MFCLEWSKIDVRIHARNIQAENFEYTNLGNSGSRLNRHSFNLKKMQNFRDHPIYTTVK